MPSSHLILCRPLLLLPPIPPSIRVFSSESTLRMRWPKYWSFSFNISPFSEHPGLISSRMGLVGSPCSPRDSQESSLTPQFKSINSFALSFLYGPTLTSIHDHWKNHSLDWRVFCWQSNVSGAAAAKSLQSCLTLCDPTDGSPPSSPIPGILQARTLEWVAIAFSSAWKWKVKVKLLNRVWLLPTPWTAAYQAPLSMGFSRKEYWSGVPLPSPAFTAN